MWKGGERGEGRRRESKEEEKQVGKIREEKQRWGINAKKQRWGIREEVKGSHTLCPVSTHVLELAIALSKSHTTIQQSKPAEATHFFCGE